MVQGQIKYRQSVISYRLSGSGPRVAVCFHGYGEEANSFDFLSQYAGNEYRFLAIDLPYHGQTDWQEGLNLLPAELEEILHLLFEQVSIDYRQPDFRYTLAGYSLGGRVCLSLYQLHPEAVDRLVLLAPDGLKMNFWYWLATQTRAGNQFFAFTMKKPQWFFGLIKLMHKTGLINTSIFKFVKYYIGDPVVRQELYNRWTSLRKLKPDLSTVKKQITQNHTALRLIYGIHDRIILSSVGKKFIRAIETESRLIEIHAGHQVLHEKHAKEILPAFLQ